MGMAKHKKTKMHPLIKVGLVLLAVLTVINIVSLQLQVNELQAEKVRLEEAIGRKSAANEDLKESLKEGPTDESMAKIARDVLGYASPGERVFIDNSKE